MISIECNFLKNIEKYEKLSKNKNLMSVDFLEKFPKFNINILNYSLYLKNI
uniref:Uncharacterized protein n=1 Tax=viral metagenome TaxID=1070528 RepID=A0A6C0AEH2_9ZZZZ